MALERSISERKKSSFLLEDYSSGLKGEAEKRRYSEKLSYIGGLDPYYTKDWVDEVDLWPTISHIDIGMYLLLTPSPYSGNELRNYKSMDCYRNFLAGWVRDIHVMSVTVESTDTRVVISKVNHSQRLSDKPLIPWIVAEPSGKIVTGHCNCMAGLGETCSHVASLLWAIEAGVRIRDSMTVTQKKAYWVTPNGIKDVPYAPVKDIDFIGKKRSESMIKKLDITTPSSVSASRKSRTPTPAFSDSTQEEKENFLSMLSTCVSKPVILSLVEPFSSDFVPKVIKENFPVCLATLYKPEYLKLNYGELVKLAEECVITVSDAEAEAVELNTKEQVKSSLWLSMRAGRVTALHFKAASCTDLASPSVSLIASICYPELHRFKTDATTWGCKQEKSARDKYLQLAMHSHTNLKVEESGLFLNVEYPFIGASPDGLVTCDCCGDGIVEIKCPFSHKDHTIDQAVQDREFCLKSSEQGFSLKSDHSYFYQVQCQLFCTQRPYCDFVVWTKEDLHIDRIYPDSSFWSSKTMHVQQFFMIGILPELLGKHYSRPVTLMPDNCSQPSTSSGSVTLQTTSVEDQSSQSIKYCYCQQEEEGEMIGCDNPHCKYQWFHFSCLKLTSTPKSKFWYCPDCRVLPQFKKKKSKEIVNLI